MAQQPIIEPITLTDAIVSLRPGSTFILENEDYSKLQWLDPNTTPPTKPECDAEIVRLQIQQNLAICKDAASALLYDTDWTTINDVTDPSSSPYLTNQAEFIAWRKQIRQLAVYPIENPIFPPKPVAIWA